jgi:diacylglycerol kinase family enzyme
MPDHVLIFANPIAGRGQGRTVARRLERELVAAGFSARVLFDRPSDLKPGDFEPTTAGISIGGDGTLRGVVNLLFANGREGPPLLPVPMGTANLMGRHLGVAWPPSRMPEAVIETIKQNKILKLDGGIANGRIFLLMAGVGIDAQVVHLLDRMRRGPIDMTSYLLPAAMTVAGYQFPPITVEVDGRAVIENTPAIAIIGNVKEYGTGFPILTEAIPTDGLLDVCVMPCQDWRDLTRILMLVATGEHAMDEDVIYTQGKSICVTSPERVPVQADGDSAGFTPLDIKLHPRQIPFLVPASRSHGR